jgi:hypothetical protein
VMLVKLASALTGTICRGKNQRNKGISIISFSEEGEGIPSSSTGGSARCSSSCGTSAKLDQDTVLLTLKDKLRKLGQRLHEVIHLLEKLTAFVLL